MTGRDKRLPALRRFAIAITALNVLGHLFLGFEQSWAHPLVALATGYSTELLLELCHAWSDGRRVRFAGGWRRLVDFLLSAHISSLAVAMLLYANERLLPIAFATAVAIGSKSILRAPVNGGHRHFLNPSNTGIALTLLLFPWVGIAPPYMFTEYLYGAADWILPLVIVASGSFLNARFTHRVPLILGWLLGFALQALLRHLTTGCSLPGALLPMTGPAFVLFTFYMVPDPGTTPESPRAQALFGASVAFFYSVLMVAHAVFGLFFSLVIVCTLRGIGLFVLHAIRQGTPAGEEAR